MTQEEVCQLLDYDPDTGVFRWREGNCRRSAGDVAGNLMHDGRYERIGIGGRSYLSHRLAWFYVYGEWPKEIDHINRNKRDNRIANLRAVTRKENQLNRGLNKNNTSGVKGVMAAQGKWMASYCKRYLGIFDTKDAAIMAREEAEKRDGV
jgi:hypothetical protein